MFVCIHVHERDMNSYLFPYALNMLIRNVPVGNIVITHVRTVQYTSQNEAFAKENHVHLYL